MSVSPTDAPDVNQYCFSFANSSDVRVCVAAVLQSLCPVKCINGKFNKNNILLTIIYCLYYLYKKHDYLSFVCLPKTFFFQNDFHFESQIKDSFQKKKQNMACSIFVLKKFSSFSSSFYTSLLVCLFISFTFVCIIIAALF